MVFQFTLFSLQFLFGGKIESLPNDFILHVSLKPVHKDYPRDLMIMTLLTEVFIKKLKYESVIIHWSNLTGGLNKVMVTIACLTVHVYPINSNNNIVFIGKHKFL